MKRILRPLNSWLGPLLLGFLALGGVRAWGQSGVALNGVPAALPSSGTWESGQGFPVTAGDSVLVVCSYDPQDDATDPAVTVDVQVSGDGSVFGSVTENRADTFAQGSDVTTFVQRRPFEYVAVGTDMETFTIRVEGVAGMWVRVRAKESGDTGDPGDFSAYYGVMRNGFSPTATPLTPAAGGGSLADGDYGDITVSGSGATWTTDNGAITYAKIQDVSATDRLLGRSTAGAGDIEEITCTAVGRDLLDDANITAQRSTLGLGTIATQNANNVTISGGAVTGITDITVADGGTGASTAAGAATNLGLGTGDSPQFTAVNLGHATDTTFARVSAGVASVEGSNILLASGLGSITQSYDADLAALAGLTSAADKGIQWTGAGTAATYDLTAAAKTVLDDSTVTAMRGTMDVGYTVQWIGGTISPADATTYYVSSGNAAVQAVQGQQRILMPRAGTVTKAKLSVGVAGTLGTTENSTVSLRLNNTTDTAISAVVQCSAAVQTYTSSPAIAVVEDDYLEIKWACPTWSTNPASVNMSVLIWIDE